MESRNTEWSEHAHLIFSTKESLNAKSLISFYKNIYFKWFVTQIMKPLRNKAEKQKRIKKNLKSTPTQNVSRQLIEKD